MEEIKVILRDGADAPDGTELRRWKQGKHVVVHERDDASEPTNWAIRKASDNPGIGLISIPSEDWERIFGGQNGR
jgi:hypothetical protein